MERSNTFPLDHFGIVASPLLQAVINQSGDKRKRKTAFNNIERMLKSFALIPKTSKLKSFGLVTDEAGGISWQAAFEAETNVTQRVGLHEEPSPCEVEASKCTHQGTQVSTLGHAPTSNNCTCECGTILLREEAEANGCHFNT
jgi:hypothetical protein